MQEVILDFFNRFKTGLTQSVYALKTIQDYQQLKAYYDYLEYDRSTIFRPKGQSCGLRNIGNTCYFNALLQILYHINYLREKIFCTTNSNSKFVCFYCRFLKSLRKLFGLMCVGKMVYSDPSELFQILQQMHPQVFIEGIQNDFHEIFTLLLDQLSGAFKEISIEQHKNIHKILFGKLQIKTDFKEGSSVKYTRFNIINLECSYKNLQDALAHWQKYQVQDYKTEKGSKVQAEVNTNFIQTPALMTFFINRVSYEHGQLVKNNSQFNFSKLLIIQKSQADLTTTKKLTKIQEQTQNQIDCQIQALKCGIKTLAPQKDHLNKTLEYLQSKQFQDINLPNIHNSLGEESYKTTKKFITEEIHQIEIQLSSTQKQIANLQNKKNSLAEQNQSQIYVLWAVMIHQGSANFGHYKICINNTSEKDSWTEFNDRMVRIRTYQDIQQYKRKGEICCLFYRRQSLVCNPFNSTITMSLKSLVTEADHKIKKEIDIARLLQNLHQCAESAGILLEHELQMASHAQNMYFFKPILHCLQAHKSLEICRGVITYEMISHPDFVLNFQQKMLSQNSKLKIPQINLDLPLEYLNISQVIKQFIIKQGNILKVGQAYQNLVDELKKITVKNQIVMDNLKQILQIIIMKGIFYLALLSNYPKESKNYHQINNAIEILMEQLNSCSQFVLRFIPIHDEIKRKNIMNTARNIEKSSAILKPVIKNENVTATGEIFRQKFGLWIQRRKNIHEIDESIIVQDEKIYSQYVIQ